jgi:hypothetical protein
VWSIARRRRKTCLNRILSMESCRNSWHFPRTVEYGWLAHLWRAAHGSVVLPAPPAVSRGGTTLQDGRPASAGGPVEALPDDGPFRCASFQGRGANGCALRAAHSVPASVALRLSFRPTQDDGIDSKSVKKIAAQISDPGGKARPALPRRPPHLRLLHSPQLSCRALGIKNEAHREKHRRSDKPNRQL